MNIEALALARKITDFQFQLAIKKLEHAKRIIDREAQVIFDSNKTADGRVHDAHTYDQLADMHAAVKGLDELIRYFKCE